MKVSNYKLTLYIHIYSEVQRYHDLLQNTKCLHPYLPHREPGRGSKMKVLTHHRRSSMRPEKFILASESREKRLRHLVREFERNGIKHSDKCTLGSSARSTPVPVTERASCCCTENSKTDRSI